MVFLRREKIGPREWADHVRALEGSQTLAGVRRPVRKGATRRRIDIVRRGSRCWRHDAAEAMRPFRKDIILGERVIPLAVIGTFEYQPDYKQRYSYYASQARLAYTG